MKRKPHTLQKWLIKAYLWAAELLYHRFAWAYECVAWLVSFGYWSQWREDALAYLLPGPTLEVGFGTGALLIEMNIRGYDVVGLELSAQMQRLTGRKLRRKGMDVLRVRGNTGTLPFPGECFVNVLSTFPSGYIVGVDTLSEIKRVLDKDGRCVIVGLSVCFKSRVLNWLLGWITGKGDRALIEYFSNKVSEAGFSYHVIVHEADAYSLPVLILEKDDA